MFVSFLIKRVDKKLNFGLIKKNGRNNKGRICVFHRGAGKRFRMHSIDFHRRIQDSGMIYKITSCPLRSAPLGLVLYDSGFFSYIILNEVLKLGFKFLTSLNSNVSLIRNSLVNLLGNLEFFSIVSMVELKPYKGASIARAAGSGLILIGESIDGRVLLKSVSGWLLKVSKTCISTLGYVAGSSHKMKKLSRAGERRRLGWRPVVRGVAMNPCDHPHGGGEGKKSPPKAHRSPWGKLTKGSPTKKKKIHKISRRLFKKVK